MRDRGVPELIARELSDGSLRVVIQALSDAELVRLLTQLADLRESFEEQKLFCSAAMVSLCQDRVRDERSLAEKTITAVNNRKPFSSDKMPLTA